MNRYSRSQLVVWFRSPRGMVALVALTVLSFYQLTEHTMYAPALVPFGIFLLCPLMHLFMGHGGYTDQAVGH